jgi:hypothetical protein
VTALPPANVGLIGALHREVERVARPSDEERRASIESESEHRFSTAVESRAAEKNLLRSACFPQ